MADAAARERPAPSRRARARARRDAGHDAAAVRTALRCGRGRDAGVRLPLHRGLRRSTAPTHLGPRTACRRRGGARAPQVATRGRQRAYRALGDKPRRYERHPGGRGARRPRGRGGAVPDRARAWRGPAAGSARRTAADARHRRGSAARGPPPRPTVRADRRPAGKPRDGHHHRCRIRLEFHSSAGLRVRQPHRRRRRRGDGDDVGAPATPVTSTRRCWSASATGRT